jgi:hypothetical protein
MFEACSDLTKVLAFVGGIFIYGLFALLFSQIFLAIRKKNFNELDDNESLLCILCSIAFPAAIVAGVLLAIGWWVYKVVSLPYNAVTRKELKETEKRLESKIIFNTPISKNNKEVSKIVAGDLVTGIKGNPDNYIHLNEGCVCRVKSINEKGSMQLVLIDHKEFSKHRDYIGNTFTAPARNFVKYKKK